MTDADDIHSRTPPAGYCHHQTNFCWTRRVALPFEPTLQLRWAVGESGAAEVLPHEHTEGPVPPSQRIASVMVELLSPSSGGRLVQGREHRNLLTTSNTPQRAGSRGVVQKATTASRRFRTPRVRERQSTRLSSGDFRHGPMCLLEFEDRWKRRTSSGWSETQRRPSNG